MSPTPKTINQTDKEKASLAALKTVSTDTKVVLERVERLERLLVSVKDDMERAAKACGDGIFMEYWQQQTKYIQVSAWLRASGKRIDEVL